MPTIEGKTIDEVQVRRNKAKVLAKINQKRNMSQGFRLVNVQQYQKKLLELKRKLESHEYLNEANRRQDAVILDIMSNTGKINNYLEQETSQKLQMGSMDFRARNQLANAQLKKKQLFLMFMEITEAQEELKEFSVTVASTTNGTVKQPPGAYFGVKDFHGALDKITNRKRHYDIGDLKDAARMTIIFETLDDMVAAKALIRLTDEFKQLQHHQSAMKDRYGTSTGDDARFNCGATDAGYKDIKFFLKMSNGHIGELQLNTRNMIVAKKNGHIIYDILRDGGSLDQPFTITNHEVLAKVQRNMSEKWFTFIRERVPKAKQDLPCIIALVERMNKNMANGNPSLVVYLEEIDALSRVSLCIYEQGDNGRVLLD
ncbi:hypothetical protein M9194_06870 [Vibrio sp. S4M6]|uniref:hypothetical protein n=1 Tax=Vibrio sinus TaxID=2946865 RepID=UPI00202A7AFF|nr:hypothetical protein [Vibrio sinus]MCL9781147.1 hypothetical protein [Vibrio sinus]